MVGDRGCRLHRCPRGAGLRGGRPRRRRGRRPVQRAPRVRPARGAVRRGQDRRHRADGADHGGARRRGRRTPRRVQVRRGLGRPTAAHLHQNVTGTVNLLEAMERTGVPNMVFSSSAATFGTPDVRPGHRGDADAPGVAVRREQADRRVGDPRPGSGDRAAAHLAALLQRGRLGQRRPLRHQPAQPVPDRLRDAPDGKDAADQRRRLRHPRRHLRARLRPRRRPRRLARRGRPAARGRRGRCCRSTTSAAARARRCARSWTPSAP